MKPARPPSPDYYRRFVRQWCGQVADDCKIYVTTGKRQPHVVAGAIEVGAEWLTRQAIPRATLEDRP